MKKGKIHFFRLIFSAVVAAVLFYFVARELFMFFWNFDLISERHWTHIWNKWRGGWVIRKPKEVMFFVAVLLLIPGFLLAWFSVYVFPWLKILRFPLTYHEKKKKERLQAESLAAALGPADIQKTLESKKEPEKVIKISSQKLQHIDQLRGKKSHTHHAAVQQSTPAETGNVSAPQPRPATKKMSKEDEAVARFDLWKQLADSLAKQNLFVLRRMKIVKFPVNTMVITQQGLFLLCEGPADGHSWEVNETANPPVWKTETGDIPSPLRPVLEAKAVLQNYFTNKMPQLAGLEINCCMILDHGNITNHDELLKYLEEWDISVLRMGSCQTTLLPDTNALTEYIKSQPPSTPALNDAVAVAILDLMETENGG